MMESPTASELDLIVVGIGSARELRADGTGIDGLYPCGTDVVPLFGPGYPCSGGALPITCNRSSSASAYDGDAGATPGTSTFQSEN